MKGYLIVLTSLVALLSLSVIEVEGKVPEELFRFLDNDLLPFIDQNKDLDNLKFANAHSKGLDTALLRSGVQYRKISSDIVDGEYGKLKKDDFIMVNYMVLKLDGSIVANTWKDEKPELQRIEEMLPGWRQGINYMKPGEIFEFFIPGKLAYGQEGIPGKIEPDTDVIIICEIVSINPELPWMTYLQFKLKDDFVIPPFKNYHVIAFGIYMLFRMFSGRFIEYLTGIPSVSNTKRKKAKGRHILFETNEKAQCDKVLKELKKDASKFQELAKEHSKCPSGKNGGDLGWFNQGVMVSEFDEAFFNPKSPENTVLGPIKTQFGYHLILIEEREHVVKSDEKKEKVEDKKTK